MSRRIIQISPKKLPWVRTTGRRPDLEFAHLFNNKSSIKMRDGELWGGWNLSLILFFGSLSLYICIWICLENDKDNGDDDDDERKKKKRGLGTKGGWSESHAVVKTCLCINSFKNATPLPMAACSSYAWSPEENPCHSVYSSALYPPCLLRI